jgi:oligosaccharide repeat unit polymerase
MWEEISRWMISFLKREYHKSLYKRVMDSFFAHLHLKEIPRIDLFSLPERIVSPYIFIVIFICFLGLSDHALSFTGTVGIVMGISGFIIGMQLTRLKRPQIPEKYFYPLLVVFCVCVVGMFVDWSLFLKISLIPMVLLFLTGKHTRDIFIMVFLASLVILHEGFWGVALPFTFLSLIFLATRAKGSLFDDNLHVLAFTFIVVGIFFWVLDVLLFGGFPLLSPEARGSLDTTFTMLSHLLPIGCVMTIVVTKNRTASVVLVFISVVLMALLGYRTQVILVMLASCCAALLKKVITGTEAAVALTGAGVLGLVLTSLRDIILHAEIGIVEAVRARASMTLDIYDMMATLGGVYGFTKGQVYVAAVPSLAGLMPKYAYSPRWYIAEFVGMDVSATSTILGPLAVDFGLVGIFVGMTFLGYLLSRLYWRKTPLGVSLYCIVLAYSLIGIETGIVDLEVLLIFFLAFLYVLSVEQST